MLYVPRRRGKNKASSLRGRLSGLELPETLKQTWPVYLLRIAVLVTVLSIIRPPQILVTLDQPQEVTSSNPVAGIHTRLTDEVEPWKIQRTLQMVREMGTPWIVEYFPWPYIEPEEDQYSWGHSDTVIEHAENQGLSVIARLGWVPGWARPQSSEQETTLTYLDEDHFDEFAEFVAKFAARYAGRVDHIIKWNEPNNSFEMGYRPVDPEGYVELLRAVYGPAHAANPGVVILAGALAPTLEPEGSSAGLDDLDYLERIYEAGGAATFDALAVHAYGLTNPPGDPPAADKINFRRTELLRAVMVAYGDETKSIYITEAGWNDHPRWIHGVSPSQRIEYTIGAYEWGRENWPWCRSIAMWAYRYPSPQHNYQDYYAFVTETFEPRVIYLEVQKYLE